MSAKISSPACPVCGAAMRRESLRPWCPACAWQDLADDESTDNARGDMDALFAVDDLDVLEEIARGGGGIVYRARQRHPPREVALKILPPHQVASPEMRARFRAEAEMIAALEHSAILPVYAVGEYRDMPYFTMKLAAGGTLAARRAKLGGHWRAIGELLATIADAVHFAHTHGVIHRDLKPGNVLFDDAGRPYVSDFGLAKFTDATAPITRSLALLGTPAYLAPEVAQNGAAAATIASDVYGLGTILYELLAGQPPFTARSLPELVRQVVTEPPVEPRRLVPDVPRDLEIICLRCLAKAAGQRFATASELADDLRRWLEGRPIASRLATRSERLIAWTRRNPAVASLSTILGIILLGTAVVLLRHNENLRQALQRVSSAERNAQQQLHDSLVNEARLLRESARAGERATALAKLERAAGIHTTPELRTELIAALARPDLVAEELIPVSLPARNATIAFRSDLSHFLAPDSEDGFIERETGSATVRRHYRSGRGTPALYLSFTYDDRAMVATYPDRSVEVWETPAASPWWSMEGDAVPTITHGGHARREPVVAVHPCGDGLVHVAADRRVRWVERSTQTERIVLEPAENIFELSFAPAGDVLLVVRSSRCAAYTWPDATLLWQRDGDYSPCKPAWHPDGRRLAVGLEGRNDIWLGDATSGRTEEYLSGHAMHPRILRFSPDGGHLYSAGWDGVLLAWDTGTGAVAFSGTAYPSVLHPSADGKRLAFGRGRTDIAIATLAPGAFFQELVGAENTQRITCDLAVSPDGRWAASIDHVTLRLWDLHRGCLAGHESLPPATWASVIFDHDGQSLLHSGFEAGMFRRHLTVSDSGDAVRLGEPVAIAPGHSGLLREVDRTTGDWWVEEPAPLHLRRWPSGDPKRGETVVAIGQWDLTRFSPDRRLLATSHEVGDRITVYACDTGRQIAELPTKGRAAIGFSPDGLWLLSGTNKEYRLWDVTTWTPGPSWPARTANHASGNFLYSPDGTCIALRDGRGGLELRETQRYELLMRLEPPTPVRSEHFAWSQDGRSIYLLCTGHRLVRWDLHGIRRELAGRNLDW